MDAFYDNKTVLITGAANGIGKAIAKKYAELGANLILVDFDFVALEALEHELSQENIKVNALICDVSELKSVQQCFATIDKLGLNIDILINNVGISKNSDFISLNVEDFDYVYRTNLRSVMLFSQFSAKKMKQMHKGVIISIASTRAMMSEESTEAYSASKGGIVALTHAMAASLGQYGISVNCISPGWIQTNNYESLSDEDHKQHFSQRVGRPEDVVKACIYLTQENNDFMTGQNIVIDGGMTKKMIYF